MRNNQFFLYTRNLEVQRWLKSRTARGLTTTLVQGSTFAIVDEVSFTDYDAHRKKYQQQNPQSRVIPKCELLLSWMVNEEEWPAVQELKEYDETYYCLSYEQFDKLVTWVYRKMNEDDGSS